LDRAFFAAAFARGGYGVLSKADFGYESAHGIYGQGRTPLDTELNMQVQLTRLLSELDGISDEAKVNIENRHNIDEYLISIRDGKPDLYDAYKAGIVQPYVGELVQQGKPLLWGEQVRPVITNQLLEIKRGQDNNYSPQTP